MVSTAASARMPLRRVYRVSHKGVEPRELDPVPARQPPRGAQVNPGPAGSMPGSSVISHAVETITVQVTYLAQTWGAFCAKLELEERPVR